MMRIPTNRASFLAVLAACVFATAACDSILGWASGAYRGPRPDEAPLSGEAVIVRSIHPQPTIDVLILDRVRYLDGDPHNVNRVVQAVTTDIHAQVRGLNLRVGDRLVVSTRFEGIGEVGDLREVPDWPGHRYHEYPIGLHALTAVARAP